MSLQQLSEHFGGSLINGDCQFNSLSTDTRQIHTGDLFVALVGPNFDAHEYLQDAIGKGCAGLVIEVDKQTHLPAKLNVPVWIVNDTVQALGQIAMQSRNDFSGALVAITGSTGKTTVKGLLSSICTAHVGSKHTYATSGNFNNHIGVPLCLLQLVKEHRYAIIEMGASAAGEIDYLSTLAKPHVALVNNVMPAHVEGFGSIDAIATAKGEIYQNLVDEGIAVINGDDVYAPQWLAQNRPRQTIIFSVRDNHVSAQVYAKNIRRLQSGCYTFELVCGDQMQEVTLSILGQHNIANVLAATACSYALGIDIQSIVQGVECFRGESGRLELIDSESGCLLINDSYNANPGSVNAAIDVLSAIDLKTILVLGDMAELGSESATDHQKAGAYAAEKGIDLLLTIGGDSQLATKAFGPKAKHFDSLEALLSYLEPLLDASTSVLVKGSRSARLERVIDVLKIGGKESC